MVGLIAISPAALAYWPLAELWGTKLALDTLHVTVVG